MRLKCKDQIHVSAVKPDSLRPGEEFEVGEAFGQELLTRHPSKFERLDAPPPPRKAKAAPKAANKAAPAPANKAAD